MIRARGQSLGRSELTVDGPVDDAVLAEVRELAEEMLANTVIEDVLSVHTLDTETVTAGETH